MEDNTPSLIETPAPAPEGGAAAAPAAEPPKDEAAKPNEGGEKAAPEGDKSAEAPKPKEGEEQSKGAPEQYEAFKAPEGFVIDEQLLGEFTPVLKELNLPQEQAQKLIDFAPKLTQHVATQAAQAARQDVITQLGLGDHAKWADQVKNDQEIGGDALAENLGLARKAMANFFAPEAVTLLSKVGLGNHPEIIRGLVKVGRAISEDGFVPGGKTRSQQTAQSYYDKSQMNP